METRRADRTAHRVQAAVSRRVRALLPRQPDAASWIGVGSRPPGETRPDQLQATPNPPRPAQRRLVRSAGDDVSNSRRACARSQYPRARRLGPRGALEAGRARSLNSCAPLQRSSNGDTEVRMVNPHIFREYDIRGVADRDLTDDVVRAIGLAIGKLVYDSPGPVVVGRDCRLTSPRIFQALTDGIRAIADVVDIGIVPTPVTYFAQQHLIAAATVMVTGSHNPAEDNGLKIMLGDESVHGRAITAIGRRAAELMARPAQGPRRPMTKESVGEAYIARAVAELRLGPRRPKVVVDAGNGSGGPIATALYTELGFDVEPLYCTFDGRFPNHHPDPTQPENLAALIQAVQVTGAEVGIALDGDADRLGAGDATGRILWGDQLLVILGRAILEELPDATFVAEVKCSQSTYDALPTCEMWKVGHALIKERMQKTGAALA